LEGENKMTDEEYNAFIDKEKKTAQVKNMIRDSHRLGIKDEELLLICNHSYAYGLPLILKDGENFNTLFDIPIIIDYKMQDNMIVLTQIADIAKYHAVKIFDYKAWLNEIGAKSVSVIMPKIEGKEYNSIICDELREEK
jgi:hypothetical protein